MGVDQMLKSCESGKGLRGLLSHDHSSLQTRSCWAHRIRVSKATVYVSQLFPCIPMLKVGSIILHIIEGIHKSKQKFSSLFQAQVRLEYSEGR